MRGFEVREKLPRWPNLPLFHVVETLTNTFLRTGAGSDIEKMLIGGGVLNDCLSPPIDCDHHGVGHNYGPLGCREAHRL